MAEFVEDESQNNAHHGPPILTDRDLHILQAMTRWIQVVRTEYSKHKGDYKDWLPSEVDVRKSRLFWRLRSGKEPLPEPPPTAFSCPWYEIIDEDRPHWVHNDVYIHDDWVSIAQCRYKLEKMEGEIPAIVSFGSYKFKVWRGSNQLTSISVHGQTEITATGFWIQRILEDKIN
jgi:hypothetical protein